MASLKIKQINNAGSVPNSVIAFDGDMNVWRKMSHFDEFGPSDLDTNGVLTITHGLGRKYVYVAVYDDNDLMVIPDQVKAIDVNTVAITLASFKANMPNTESWNVSIS